MPFAWLSNIRIRAYTCIYRLRLLLRTAHSSNGEAVKDYSRAESPSAVITSAVTSAEPLITLRNIGRFLARVLYSGRWNKRSQTSGAVAPGLAPAERAGRRCTLQTPRNRFNSATHNILHASNSHNSGKARSPPLPQKGFTKTQYMDTLPRPEPYIGLAFRQANPLYALNTFRLRHRPE